MFTNCSALNGDLSNWDVSNVTDMSVMFQVANSFNQDISNWDVSNVTDLSATFQGAESFNRDLSHWDTSKVRSMFGTFGGVKHNLNIGNWNVSSVTGMTNMFSSSSFNNISSRGVQSLILIFIIFLMSQWVCDKYAQSLRQVVNIRNMIILALNSIQLNAHFQSIPPSPQYLFWGNT